MVLAFNNNHTIYYHMDAQWSVWHGPILLNLIIWLSSVGSMLYSYPLILLTKQDSTPIVMVSF